MACVDSEKVKVSRRFLFENQPSVAHCDARLGWTIGEESKFPPGDVDHLRINFIKANLPAGFAIGRDSAHAEADDANR
jgi:hypothetical protein